MCVKCDKNFNMEVVNLHLEELVSLKTRSYIPDSDFPPFFDLVKLNKTVFLVYDKIKNVVNSENDPKKNKIFCSVGGELIEEHMHRFASLTTFFEQMIYNSPHTVS